MNNPNYFLIDAADDGQLYPPFIMEPHNICESTNKYAVLRVSDDRFDPEGDIAGYIDFFYPEQGSGDPDDTFSMYIYPIVKARRKKNLPPIPIAVQEYGFHMMPPSIRKLIEKKV